MQQHVTHILRIRGWLIPLLVLTAAWWGLAFFNFAQTDDFIAIADAEPRSLINYILHVRNTWSGRYTPALLAWIFVQTGLEENYWLHSFVWWGMLACICYLMVPLLIREVKNRLTAALLIMLILSALMPEPQMAWYWFSSAATYTSAFLLFALLLFFISGLPDSSTGFPAVAAAISAFLLAGTNEPAAAFCGLALCYLAFINKKRIPLTTLLLVGLGFLAGLALLVTASGNVIRLSYGSEGNVGTAILMGIIQTAILLYHLGTEPILWMLVWGGYQMYGKCWLKQVWIPIVITLTALIPVLYFSGGSLPLRVHNFLAPALLLLWALLPALNPQKEFFLRPLPHFRLYPFLLVAGLLFSGKTAPLICSWVAAPVHRSVMLQAQRMKASGMKSEFIAPYEERKRVWLQQHPPGRKVLLRMMETGPEYLAPLPDE